MRTSKRLLLLVLSLSVPPALAAEPAQPRYNAVEFQSEAQREVRNDLLNATLYIELNDSNPATLASAINKSVNDALRAAKEHKGVTVRSGNNQTRPVYSRDGKQQGWRGRAEIRIESRDFDAASALIGRLQAKMQPAHVGFSISPDTRRAVQDELAIDAIRAFKARADVLKTALAGRSYKIVRLNVDGGHQPPQPLFAAARAGVSAESVTPPTFESGMSLVTVVVRGTIEIVE
jgi:predicted secreted protein